ncbi:hypothetical protein ILUMI_08094 [Ignelater luminosus]|uniref:Uncharacterized protein n=1 Tax=Ignelater luminosus TaxID=2038154 RepID=A0A8K0GG90_IGNLU|nr:hypothetical protein ILUMI_08094 [Ignelater luminosus]
MNSVKIATIADDMALLATKPAINKAVQKPQQATDSTSSKVLRRRSSGFRRLKTLKPGVKWSCVGVGAECQSDSLGYLVKQLLMDGC